MRTGGSFGSVSVISRKGTRMSGRACGAAYTLREPWMGPVVTVCGRPFGSSTWTVMGDLLKWEIRARLAGKTFRFQFLRRNDPDQVQGSRPLSRLSAARAAPLGTRVNFEPARAIVNALSGCGGSRGGTESAGRRAVPVRELTS